MSHDEGIAEQLHDQVFGSRDPTGMLIDQGRLPDGWVTQYLDHLRIATAKWGDQPLWPRKLVAAVHFASRYLNLRYDVWRQSTGGRHESTERDLASIRSPSEIFLMRGSTDPKNGRDPTIRPT